MIEIQGDIKASDLLTGREPLLVKDSELASLLEGRKSMLQD
jgi:hypothetical protein